MSYLIFELDERFERSLDDLVMSDPETLSRIVERARDWESPIRYVAGFGDDTYEGELETCVCNIFRYEKGHMKSCPLTGYPPEALLIDRRP